VVVNLSPSTDISVRIGYAGWSPEKIAANADAVAAALVERFVSQKWNNVRSIYIKGQATAAVCVLPCESARVRLLTVIWNSCQYG
jgi:ribosome biogenesis protein UTP30